jgi:hypothetical protein
MGLPVKGETPLRAGPGREPGAAVPPSGPVRGELPGADGPSVGRVRAVGAAGAAAATGAGPDVPVGALGAAEPGAAGLGAAEVVDVSRWLPALAGAPVWATAGALWTAGRTDWARAGPEELPGAPL